MVNLVLMAHKAIKCINILTLLLWIHWRMCKLQTLHVELITLFALELSPSCFKMDVGTQFLHGETTLEGNAD